MIKWIATAIAMFHLVSCGAGQQPDGQYEQQLQQQDPRLVVGTVFNDDCFRGQSIIPPKGCQLILWTKATGPQCKLWLNDLGKDARGVGRAQLQIVPEGQYVWQHPVTKKMWKQDCKNRVTVAIPPSRPQPQVVPPQQQRYYPPPVVQQRYCPPPVRQQRYCLPPMVQQKRYCPPVMQQRQYCPPGQYQQQQYVPYNMRRY